MTKVKINSLRSDTLARANDTIPILARNVICKTKIKSNDYFYSNAIVFRNVYMQYRFNAALYYTKHIIRHFLLLNYS